ncbi:MAG TPA: LamG-like jellyroll fold domain-containing protein [Candidatus Limnocylindrales bacterium]|nr:LamG-like jellyroll fold domain-containing protein [Candidatus Limnocylindrales bacterium]
MKRIMKFSPGKVLSIGLTILAALAVATVRAQGTTSCTPPPAGLVGWWKGDGTALDSVSANNSVNQNVAYTNGVVGQAFAFDPENFSYGTYSGIQVADRPAYALTNALTIETWLRPRGDGYVIFFRGDHRPGMDPYYLSMQANNTLRFGICDAAGNSAFVETTVNYFAWTHVAAMLDGSTGTLSLYTNGVLAAQTNTTIRPFGDLLPDQSPGIGIGNVNDGGNNFPFIGDLDEIALYSRALTPAEIQAIYNAGSAGKCAPATTVCVTPPSGLIAWWRAESNALDSIGPNNGTLVGETSYAPGKVGQAFNFSAVGDAVSAPTSGFPTGTSDRTIECWVYLNSFISGTESFIAGYGNFGGTGGQAYAMGVYPDQRLYFSQWGSGIFGPVLNTNQWYHVAVTSGGTNSITLYLNGTNVASGSLPFDTPAGSQLFIGGVSAPFNTRQMVGLIDEVSIYNRALTPAEIQSIYNAGSAGKCFTPVPPSITSQPTNQTVFAGQTASFSVSASGTPPLSYQWRFNTTNIVGATNTTLILPNAQLTNAGNYTVLVSNVVNSILSSNALLTVKDILDHFTWGQIPSPRFMNAPFTVVIQARGTTNGLFTNFTGTVFLGSTNGIPIDPPVSASFVQGSWTGAVTVSRPATNLVMRADDGAGQSGLANPINILRPPALDFAISGNFLLIFWPVASSNFVLETSAALSPAQWVQVASPPLKIADQYLESIQMNSSNQFYRLRFTGH